MFPCNTLHGTNSEHDRVKSLVEEREVKGQKG